MKIFKNKKRRTMRDKNVETLDELRKIRREKLKELISMVASLDRKLEVELNGKEKHILNFDRMYNLSTDEKIDMAMAWLDERLETEEIDIRVNVI